MVAVRNLFRSKFIKFVLIGLFSAMIGAAQLKFYVDMLHMSENLGYAIQLFFCIQLTFVLNAVMNWSDAPGTFTGKLIKFNWSRLATAVMSQGVFGLMIGLHMPYMLAYGLNLGIFSVFNYMVAKWYVFPELSR